MLLITPGELFRPSHHSSNIVYIMQGNHLPAGIQAVTEHFSDPAFNVLHDLVTSLIRTEMTLDCI